MKKLLLFGIIVCLCPLSVSAQKTQTLLQLMDAFREATGETKSATSSTTPTAIVTWINEGQGFVSRLTGPLAKDTTFLAIVEVQVFTIDTGVQYISSVFALEKGALLKVPPDQFDLVDTLYGSWYNHGRKVYLDLDALDLDEDSVRINYYAFPVAMPIADSVTVLCEIDFYLHGLIIDYAISRYQGSKQFWNTALQTRQAALNELKESRGARGAVVQTE